MSSEEYKELASSLLSKKDINMFKHLSLDPQHYIYNFDTDPEAPKKIPLTGCKFIDNWREWERTLRLNLVRNRAIKLNRDIGDVSNLSSPPISPKEAYVAASTAVSMEGNPLEREVFLDKARWAAIDTLTSYDNFNQNNVFAYYLKLLLLERRQAFNAEIGFAEYKSIYSEIIQSPHELKENETQNSGQNSTGEH